MSSKKNQEFIKLFGQNLRRVRNEKGITQEKLVQLSGLALSQIGRIERGEINTSLDQIKTISDSLGITTSKLFEFEANEEKNTSKEYYTSKEARKKLNVRSCDLMHMREAGKLKYVKKGNAFLYEKDSIDQEAQ